MEFKNVPKPILCYFLLNNMAKEDYTPIVVAEEPTQTFDFMVSRPPSPPLTPYLASYNSFSPTDLSRRLSSPTLDRVQQAPHRFSPVLPGVEVLDCTPTPSPGATPPQSQKPSWQQDLPLQCPFRILQSPTPPVRGQSLTPPFRGQSPTLLLGAPSPSPSPVGYESDSELTNLLADEAPVLRSTPKFEYARRPPNIDLALDFSLKSARAPVMSPLKEDLCEESPETPPVSRQSPSRPLTQSKLVQSVSTADHAHREQDDDTATVETLTIRKNSDASNQSTESARGISDTNSSGSGDTRKLSTASNLEEEERKTSKEDLDHLQRSRAGSVNKTVEYYNSLARRRRSGLSTTPYATNSVIESFNSQLEPVEGECRTSFDAKIQSKPSTNTVSTVGRPERMSLDSVGSSGSNDL